MLFHCKPVNQQKTTIFALILWWEQRLFEAKKGGEKRCRNSTFTLGSKKSVLPSLLTYTWRCENITASPCVCTWLCKVGDKSIFCPSHFQVHCYVSAALFTKILTIKNCRKCKTKIKKSFTKILTIILSVKIVLTLRVKLPCPKCKMLIVREILVLSFIVSEKNRKKDGRCIGASTWK